MSLGPTYVLDKPLIAEGAIRQYRAVVYGADNEHGAEAAAAGARVVGISQEEISADDAADGRVCNIRVLGISFAVAGAAVANDDPLAVDAEGRLVPLAAATADQEQVGFATSAAAAAGDPLTVFLTPGAQRTTT